MVRILQLMISDGARKIISRLEEAGFSAYVAGGAVRDLLMGKMPHDFDIATSAKPEQVKALFRRTIDTGLKHGTITVVENKIGYEVTTYRTDGIYTDNRRPERVEFITDIERDLARRDFTMNAMAYNPHIGLVDIYGGETDIRGKLIRCVGRAQTRFCEDALRMLRAVRFSAVLGFQIDKQAREAITENGRLIRRVSAERIREELNKILLSENPGRFALLHELRILQYIIPELEKCFDVPQKNKYHIYDVGTHTMAALSHTPKDLVLRWAALLHDIGKPNCLSVDGNGIIHFYGHHKESVRIAEDLLHRLRFDRDSIHDITVLVENHDVRVEPSAPAVKRMLARTGAELFEKLLCLQEADNRGKNMVYFPEKLERIQQVRKIYHDIIAEGQPYMVSDLLINGRDLIKIGFRAGREIGDTLRQLLDEVVLNPSLNNREYLVKRACQIKKQRRQQGDKGRSF